MNSPTVVNELWKDFSPEKVVALGFKHSGGEGWDSDWTFEAPKFRIYIDPCKVVSLSRKNPDTDPINVLIESMADLKNLLWFVEEIVI